MRMTFNVAGTPAEFRRNGVTGKAELKVGDEIVRLQSPLRLSTHVELTTTRTWKCRVGGHDIVITKVRPWLLAAARDNSFTICVDDTVVAQATGK
jgi:hypothetical protein